MEDDAVDYHVMEYLMKAMGPEFDSHPHFKRIKGLLDSGELNPEFALNLNVRNIKNSSMLVGHHYVAELDDGSEKSEATHFLGYSPRSIHLQTTSAYEQPLKHITLNEGPGRSLCSHIFTTIMIGEHLGAEVADRIEYAGEAGRIECPEGLVSPHDKTERQRLDSILTKQSLSDEFYSSPVNYNKDRDLLSRALEMRGEEFMKVAGELLGIGR